MNSFRICLVSSEVAPFAKTGGLADVATGLSRYLAAAGHDVRVYMPLYQQIRDADWPLTPAAGQQGIELNFGARRYRFDVHTTELPQVAGSATPAVPIYLVDCPELFDRDDVYTDSADEPVRYGVLSRAVLESCQRMQWAPDVFHCNDWHTSLLPLFLRTTYAWDQLFAASKTLLTIHNIGYQGTFGAGVLAELGLMEQRRHLDQQDLEQGRVNFLKTGILHADALTTVSRTYADEIQTPEYGMGLEGVLAARRQDLVGIVNGVDYGDWDPAIDPLIPHNYSPADLAGKARNKQALLAHFDLQYDPAVPVFGIVSRLTSQKGFELLPDILPILLQDQRMQIAVLGSGESRHEQYFQWLRDTWPDRVANYRGYNNELAHLIEAGADVFLMPSRYEPCGLNQMYSLKYGTVPIVRRTGGLADTVEPYDPAAGTGTGFVFDGFDSGALLHAMRQALEAWSDQAAWAGLVQRGMARDFSWQRQGREYEALYQRLRGG